MVSGRGFSAVVGCAVIAANKPIDTKLLQLDPHQPARSAIGLSGARIVPPMPMPRLKLRLAWLSLRPRRLTPDGGA